MFLRSLFYQLRYWLHFRVLIPSNFCPRIEEGCKFWYTNHIKLGNGVKFLKGSVILADLEGRIAIGKTSAIGRYTVLQAAGGSIEIGMDTTIGDFCSIYGQGGLEIGDNVMIAAGVRVIPNQHTFDDPDVTINKQACRSQGITIRDGAWLGANVCILDGVTVGTGAIVGSGSVVTRNIPDYSIAVGVPAKVIKYRPGYEERNGAA